MAINKGIKLKVALVLALTLFFYELEGRNIDLTKDAAIFDVTKFGAKGNGKPVYDPSTNEALNAISFIRAWMNACHNKGESAKVVIPKGTFSVAEVIFSGPCESPVTVELYGDIIPDSDPSQNPNNELIVFQNVDGVTLTGAGTIDGKTISKKPLDPERRIDFFSLMPSIKFENVTNAVVDGITSMNPEAFHILIVESHKVDIRNVKFDSITLSPNSDSDGVYVSASSSVSITNSFIRTGDTCVIVAPGSSNISISGVTCANGQGISIGEDPFSGALDVTGVTVKNCTFKETAYGARIFPRPQTKPSQISNIIFQDLVMDKVQNPIVINQNFLHLGLAKTISAKITDVHFRNIKGTTTTNNGVSFNCCPLSPCEGIEVADVELSPIGNALPGNVGGLLTSCLNAKVLFGGKHDGLSCGLFH